MSILKPDAYYDGVSFVDLKYLKDNGIKGILLDIDNTIIDINKNMPQEICDWLFRAKQEGFKVMILSNTNKMEKIIPIAEKFDIGYVSFAKKPFKKRFCKSSRNA
jgi:HAD superfamily phosphatase (TIGR01668 family)